MSKKDDYWVNQSKSFDLSADYYDQFRPSYPQEMVDDIVQITGINNNSKLLEIGAGSGKATELFVDKGFNITCVEPGANLVKIGEEKFKKTGQVKYITSRFEDLTLPKNAYDFIFSAQAFHWVPKPLGYEKCYHALKERHYLALYWNYYLLNGQKLEEELLRLYSEYTLVYYESKASCDNRIRQTLEEIKSSQYFKNIEVKTYPWHKICTTDEYIGFIQTGNFYLTLDLDKRHYIENKIREIIDRHGGTILCSYQCTLYLIQK